jgi:hydrogenase maturation protein HypF
LSREGAVKPYPLSIEEQGEQSPALLDVRPTVRAIVDDIQQGVAAQQIALRFHVTIAELLATACLQVRESTGLDRVALSGGVFQNRLLLEYLLKRLEAIAFRVYINRRVPPNDGGLALGQLAVAAARLRAM